IDRLRKFQGGNKYLLAYLTYKSIVRANYQVELTEHTKYDEDEKGQDKLLNAIARDIEEFEKQQEKKAIVPAQPLTSEQLLIILSERMGTGEIKRELGLNGNYLITETEGRIFKLDLYDGKLTPDPAAKFLKKYGMGE